MAMTDDSIFLDEVIREVVRERWRQDAKWNVQHHSLEKWHLILSEEVGELAEAILEDEEWQEEATQVAAVVIAMIQDKGQM
jgi:NTP pyrophosphatase (non-canonical NTP hydrolase)